MSSPDALAEAATPRLNGHDVDVVVPTFNRAHLLSETLDSLLAQTLPGAAILVVDDGSTDDTPEVVARFGSRVGYLRQPNAGKAAALNAALKQATRPLVWIFDDDDLAAPDALERMVERLNAEPACGFVYGDYDKFEETAEGERRVEPVEIPSVGAEGLFVALMHRCFVLQCGLLVRRSCYDAVGPFNEGYARSQDYEMLLRLAQRFRGARIEGVLFHQRQHSGARGTLSAPIAAARVEEAWSAYDRRLAAELRDRLTLGDYHAGKGRFSPEPTLRRGALLNKFVTFARKDRWDFAAQDFAAFLEATAASGDPRLRPEEAALLRSVFDWYSRALRSFPEAREFRASLRRSPHRDLVRACREALAFPLHYRLRLAIRRRSREELRSAFDALARLKGALYAARALLWVLARLGLRKRRASSSPPPTELDIIQGRA